MPHAAKPILVIDDHDIFRRGLRALLTEYRSDCCIYDAASVEEALASQIPTPHLVLLDIRLRGANGLDGIAPIRSQWPQARVVVLSSLEGAEPCQEALARGATAFISKGESTEQILRQVKAILNGVASSGQGAEPVQRPLTPRQHEVLLLVCRGLSNKLIARELSLSENTVRRHVQDILENFQVVSRSQAVFAARRRGLLE
ncbi:MAG TPA: response regulator transcription factor [Rhodocyclaceae bacterium]|nr:response regulator transcription factor [Rhodocyclaceae bacterium]